MFTITIEEGIGWTCQLVDQAGLIVQPPNLCFRDQIQWNDPSRSWFCLWTSHASSAQAFFNAPPEVKKNVYWNLCPRYVALLRLA